MTDKKDDSQKSVESDSSEPEEPIDLSEFMKPPTEDNDDDDDDDIIVLKDEVKITPKTEESEIKPDAEASFEVEEDEDLFSLTDELAVESDDDEDFPRFEELTLEEEDEDLFSLTDEISTESEEDEEILKPLDESVLDFEDDDAPLTLTHKTDVGSDDEEIIEITEFDEQIPAEGVKEILNFSDTADNEILEDEEFLELIDIEDENLPANADTIEFGTAEDEMEDAEIENFFSEPFEEEIELDQKGKDDLADSLGMELESDIDMTDDFAEDKNMDFAIGTAAVSAAKGEIGRNLFDDSNTDAKVEAQHEDKPEPGESRPEASQITAEIADLGTISSRQIEEAVERLINQNYSEKIESIILQVIEKTVSKEIEKLKELLLEGASTDEMK